MSDVHPNAELVRELWEALAAGDREPIFRLYAPDAVLHARGRGPISGDYRGVPAILDFMALAGELVDDLRSEVLDILASEGGAVIRYRTRADRGANHLDMEYIADFHVVDGRIVEAALVPSDQQRHDDFWQLVSEERVSASAPGDRSDSREHPAYTRSARRPAHRDRGNTPPPRSRSRDPVPGAR
jgi:ketosteroid isomerase-like protein